MTMRLLARTMRRFPILALVAVVFLFLPGALSAQETTSSPPAEAVVPLEGPEQPAAEPTYVPDRYFKATVVEVLEEKTIELGGLVQPYQRVRLRLLDGPDRGEEIVVEHGKTGALRKSQMVRQGDTVVIVRAEGFAGETATYISDFYRTPSLITILLLFLGLAVVFGRLRGASSLLGLALSLLVVVKLIVPQIAAGRDPMAVALVGSFVIMVCSMYLSHGFSRRTTVALASTALTLAATAGLSAAFVTLSRLSGMGSEESFYLQAGAAVTQFRGLLLAGIIIGTLGVLDDVTTTQAASVEEIHKADPSLSFRELYRRGASVGKEHIASLVNTLVLAYVGAALPLVVLISSASVQPLWVTLNSEPFGEEIVRTLVGSTALLLAVPLTTALAARVFGGRRT